MSLEQTPPDTCLTDPDMDSERLDSMHVELIATPSYETLPTYSLVAAENDQPPAYCASTTSTSTVTLNVPTARPNLSSGFPYHHSLSELNILPAEWGLLTQELHKAAAATPGQMALAILSGIATVAVIGEPWTSSCVGRYVWNRQVAKNAIMGLKQDNKGDSRYGQNEGSVGAVMKRWNEKWSALGVVVDLEVVQATKETGETVDQEEMEHETTCCERGHGRCSNRNCCAGKRCCGARKHCASRNSHRINGGFGRRSTCGRGGLKEQLSWGGRRGVSFRLVVQRTEQKAAERNIE